MNTRNDDPDSSLDRGPVAGPSPDREGRARDEGHSGTGRVRCSAPRQQCSKALDAGVGGDRVPSGTLEAEPVVGAVVDDDLTVAVFGEMLPDDVDHLRRRDRVGAAEMEPEWRVELAEYADRLVEATSVRPAICWRRSMPGP